VSPRSSPRSIGAAIRSARAASEPGTLLAAVQSVWASSAGERIASQAQPVRERDGVVTVRCRAATWAQELDLLQGELLARLNAAIAPGRVSSLRFIVGDDSADDRI
jgi:predicted nucleic acid-binding Zn ribbon protein